MKPCPLEMFFILCIIYREVTKMENNILARINELAKKKKTEGLTEAETAEQKELYKIYLGSIRTQFEKTLDNVSVKDTDGSIVPFKEAYAKKK